MNGKLIKTLAIPCALLGITRAEAKSPNVVYILADDMGYGDIRALNPDSQIPTPNLDRLCSQGMSFSEAHSGSSLSTPTRYGIITGRYCFRSSLKTWTLAGYSAPLIVPQVTTIGETLAGAGYNTAIIGKWHLGLEWPRIDAAKPWRENGASPQEVNIDFTKPIINGPHTRGFAYSYILPASLDMTPYVYIENGRVVNPSVRNIPALTAPKNARGVFYRGGLASDDFDHSKTLDVFADKAVDYLGKATADDPFFLYLALTAPHSPWYPAEEYRGRTKAGVYGDFVCHVDFVVGRIMEILEKNGLADNTILVFTSDNGADWNERDQQDFPQHSANYIYRSGKSNIWDGGHHIPFLLRWPAEVKAGTQCQQLMCLTDLMATMCEITGSQTPSSAIDSKSFYPALHGKRSYPGMRQSVVHHSAEGMFAIRRGDWKFIDGQGSGGWSKVKQDVPDAPGQLYDMRRDVGELVNLYYKEKKTVKKLKAELDEIKKAE